MLNFILLTALVILSYVILSYLRANGNPLANFVFGCFEMYPLVTMLAIVGWTDYKLFIVVIFASFATGIVQAIGEEEKKTRELSQKIGSDTDCNK